MLHSFKDWITHFETSFFLVILAHAFIAYLYINSEYLSFISVY